MTRYEKFKDGMEFLHGEGSAKTLEDAVELAAEFIECEFCPCYKECERICSVACRGEEYDIDASHRICRNLLKEYLSGEV